MGVWASGHPSQDPGCTQELGVMEEEGARKVKEGEMKEPMLVAVSS